MIRITTLVMALCATVIAAPAGAAIRVVTYKGQVGGDFQDRAGLFGPLPSLTFLPYVARITYDTARGHRGLSGSIDRVYGGDVVALETPILDATLTINGVTVHFPSQSYLGSAQVGGGESLYVAQGSAVSGDTLHEDQLRLLSDNTLTSLDTLLAPQLQYAASGYVALRTFDYGLNHYTAETFGSLDPYSTATMSVAGSIPEPGAWTMLIVGVGLAGAATRRRRSVAKIVP